MVSRCSTKASPIKKRKTSLRPDQRSRQRRHQQRHPTTPPSPPPSAPRPPTKSPAPAPTPTQGLPPVQRSWDATALEIHFSTDQDSSGYIESLLKHTRHPKPEYDLGCVRDSFVGEVWFFIDDTDRWRPEPFRPPTVSVSWKAGNRQGGDIDPKPAYEPRSAFSGLAANPLKPSFGLELKIPVSSGDVLELSFTLVDLDTQKTLLYQENLKITSQPCA